MTIQRADSSRIWRLWCWLWYGHDRPPVGREVQICARLRRQHRRERLMFSAMALLLVFIVVVAFWCSL